MTDPSSTGYYPDVVWIMGIDILHFGIGLKLMGYSFSSNFLRDQYSKVAQGGYRDILVGLTDFLATFKGLMTPDDYLMPLAYLSFVYYYVEDVKPIRLDFPSEWARALKVTERLSDAWMHVLTSEHRPAELVYFGSNPVLESVDALGR